MPRDYSNKLSIYLIKREYVDDEEIVKNIGSLSVEQIDNVGKIYYGESHTFPPTWLKKFFGDGFDNRISPEDNDRLKIYNASAKALFLIGASGRLFALTFGYGRCFLNPGVWEERFGLKVLVNIVDPDNVWSIDKKNMSITPKLVTEQMTKRGSVSDFGIDIEQDLLQGMTGKSKFEEFGRTVTGKDALSLSVKINTSTIVGFLESCYEKYNSDDYKRNNFEWIDHIAEIKSPQIVNNLDGELMGKIVNSDTEKIWMAIPDIVPWEKVAEFRIESNNASLGDDVELNTFIESLNQEDRDSLSLEVFKSRVISCVGAENEELINEWKAYDCLCGEIILSGKTYILSNSKWYQIETNYANTVNTYFNSIRDTAPVITLPESGIGEHEDAYNERVASELSGVCCMDRQIITLGGARGGIEFCDLLTNDKKIIHVKRYGTSSVLSHLFSQGLVSGDLFLSDADFRNKVRNKLPDTHKPLVPTEVFNPAEYTIIYAVVSRSGSLIDIPFFSKVNLRNAIKRLSGSFRFNVSFMTVNTIRE
ncbi:MAG: TIGR04141 family sporadically distributed protein [Candidatus Falkowbacteria bacterium]